LVRCRAIERLPLFHALRGAYSDRMDVSSAPTSAPGAVSSGRPDRHADSRRARRLEYFTIGWNTIEALISIAAGVAAGSTSLIGFGADSAIESSSGLVVLWRFRSASHDEARERRALKLVGISFLLLAAYVGYEAIRSLWLGDGPEVSVAGIGIAVLSLLVMPVLAHAKRKTARRLGSPSLEADSRQTSICAYLSAILLAGLTLNAVLGWWWADPVAALAMLPIIVNEGLEALRGEVCDTCA
jgi:divalent metal cation (Fe/Co/Zn/Cd) transporter